MTAIIPQNSANGNISFSIRETRETTETLYSGTHAETYNRAVCLSVAHPNRHFQFWSNTNERIGIFARGEFYSEEAIAYGETPSLYEDWSR